MEWTKENLHKLYFEKFGLTLTDEELEEQWNAAPAHTITPRGDRMNVGVSPLWVKTNIERELGRTGLPLSDARFKKVREEIIPAIDYALFLKKLGYGEHVICSRDSPDIVLMNKDNSKVDGTAYRRRGIPLEVTFITDADIAAAPGADSAEKVAHIIEKNKLNNAYGQHTTLLVVLDAIVSNLNLEKLSSLLLDKAGNFHAIDLWINEDGHQYVMANVYPSGTTHTLVPETDLDPLMY